MQVMVVGSLSIHHFSTSKVTQGETQLKLKTIKQSSIIATAITALFAGLAHAAVVPAGVVLADKQVITINAGSEPESLDPSLAESVPAHDILRNLFEGLTSLNNEGKVVPGVASSWKQTDDTTWVFNIRDNAKWSNGEAITADDFIYGMRRLVDPATASPYATSFGGFLLNGQAIAEGKQPTTDLGVRAIDAKTLEIKTAYPVAFLPDILTNDNLGPLPKKTIETHGKDWTLPGKIVTNGAYTIKSWQVNDKIVLERNTNYWDNQATVINEVTFIPIEDGNTDIKLYEAGQNDWVKQLPPGTYEMYKQKYPKDIKNAPLLGLRYYSLNNADPLLKDIRVRKALSMVIDRQVLADKITADGQKPAYSIVVNGIAGSKMTTYNWASWPMEQRVAEAKRLLAEAGVKPGQKVKFMYNTSEYHKKMAIFVAAEWKSKLGIEMEMENMEFKVLLKKRHDGDYQISRNGWVADYNDATTFTDLLQCNSTQNDHNYCNPKAKALLDKANNTLNQTERTQLITDAVVQMMGDYPAIPLLQYTVPRLVKPYVGGYTEVNAMDRFRLKDFYIIKH
jgi:oligopeptide transport system substrate-binding protein